MERKDFINLALFLPALSQLKAIFTEEELLRFNQADLEPLLKLVSPANKATASLLIKNLAHDVQYILSRVKDIKDVETLKNLAIEADKKFYSENKLNAKSFGYQSLTLSALKDLRYNSSVKPELFDGMVKSLSNHLTLLKETKESFTTLVVKSLTSPEATDTARAAQAATAAQETQNCATVFSIMSVIVVVVIAIISVVLAVVTFGAGVSGGSSLALIGTVTTIASQNPGVLILKNKSLILGTINIPLESTKVDFSKIDLETIMRCSISSVAIATAIGSFGKTPYPQNPIVGSIAVSLLANVYKLQGIDTGCS